MLSTEHSTRIRDGAFQDVDVLVTGGGGFIGSHLAHRLVGAGARVRILDDFSTGRRANLDGLDIELFEASILDDDALARAVSGCRFVLHHAAFVSVSAGELDPEACRRINVDGTRKVVEASAAAGVHRLVNTSSSAIYGDQGDEPVSESCVPDPASEYARSKLESE
ncbi:MAG: NAD-dependent epimerase/dehydratase family protein, partial [Phycisphaerales bacterium]|nr:NAD-dependent epimerase/dehydratase family protein [Phycisphaerales bacterium]